MISLYFKIVLLVIYLFCLTFAVPKLISQPDTFLNLVGVLILIVSLPISFLLGKGIYKSIVRNIKCLKK